MDARAYEQDVSVRDFLAWARPLVTGERPLRHQWSSPKHGMWRFETMFEAYQRYDWKFSAQVPGNGERIRGHTFADTLEAFDRLGERLREGLARQDADAFAEAVVAVLDWGGIRAGIRKVRRERATLMPAVLGAAEQLAPGSARLDRLDVVRYMSSGWSKVYALLLEDFPIYDSRVACAMSSLVVRYCEERGLGEVPASLEFRVPASQVKGRNPSTGTLRVRGLHAGYPRPYAVVNLRAAWLLKLMGQEGRFGELPGGERLLAVQSAMFMLGYAVIGQEALG